MNDLVRIVRYMARYKGALIGAAVCSILAATLLGGAVTMLNPLVKAIVSPADASAAAPAPPTAAPAEPKSDKVRIDDYLPDWVLRVKADAEEATRPIKDWVLARPQVRVPLVIVVLYALKALLFFVGEYTFRRVGLKITMQLREELYSRTLRQSDVFFLRHNTGEMISRILGDVGRLQNILGTDIGQMLQSIPIAVAMLVVAFVFSWQMSLSCVLVVPLFAYVTSQLGKRVKRSARRSQEQSAVLVSQMSEAFLGRRVVQAYGAEAFEDARFAQTVGRNLRQEMRVVRVLTATPAAMEIIGVTVLMVLVLIAGLLVRHGTLDPKNVLVCLTAIGLMFTHVRRISQLGTIVQQALAAARRVFEVLDEPISVRDPREPRPLARFSREIRLENVSFDYGRGAVLHGVDLVLRAGEAHALVGPSGSGKTTLAMLIPRFIDPSEGCVTFDGVDLREVSLRDLREQIALVSQETHLFDDTVRANIAYGRPDVDDAAIERAARAAHAHDFITALANGYDTRLGERGSQLSAGQRQRLAIARAFLKDAPILILDEATSALDSQSEHEVQRALEALLVGRTALIIAHRLSTVARADRIHVLEAGRVVESGAHDELLGRGGVYTRLHQLQRT